MKRTGFIFSVLISHVCYFVKGERYSVNWTKASAVGIGFESHYQDPSVIPLSPCPCDLTSHHCDVYCCCDQDCMPHDMTSFTCLEGLGGGQQTSQDLDHNCNYVGPYSPEWHGSLCYIASNNPYLGLFFKNEPIIQDFQQYVMRVHSPKYSYENSISQGDDVASHRLYYIANASIEVALHSDLEILRALLFLPQPVMSGFCVNSVPVLFLENFKHQCSVTLTQDTCENDPVLSLTSYLREMDGMNPVIYGNFPSVISDLNTLETVNASVKYLCLKNAVKFMKINGLSKTAREYLLAKWDIMDEYFEECSVRSTPVFDDRSQMCENVVLSVSYTIGWKGPRITDIHAEIVLGDIPVSLEGVFYNFFQELDREAVLDKSFLKEEPNIISHRQSFISLFQDFETLFEYMGPVLVGNDTDRSGISSNETSGQEADIDSHKMENIIERSGNPGYDAGKPLLAGYIVYNATKEENITQEVFSYVDVNEGTGLFIWEPDATSKCNAATAKMVVFGMNMFSACMHSISKGSSCSELREEILSMMSQLIQADFVSKIGALNITNEDLFLPIILDTGDPYAVTDSQRCYIPTSLQHEVIYQDIVDPGGNVLSVYQIIGISTRFLHTEIMLDLRQNESFVMLTSSVVYFESQKPSQLSRFWEAMEDRWCAGGTCWRELLYPWTHGADATFVFYNEYIINLFRDSALIVLLCLPIFYLVIQKTLLGRY